MLGGGTYPAAVRRWIFWQRINVCFSESQILDSPNPEASSKSCRLVSDGCAWYYCFTACKTTPVQGTASGGWQEMEGLKGRIPKIREKNADSAKLELEGKEFN